MRRGRARAMPGLNVRVSRRRVWSEVVVGRKGTTKDTLVVLLHGFTGTHRTWDLLKGRLAGDGYTVALPDLPGHGRSRRAMSTSSRGGPMSIEMASEAIAGLITREARGGEKRMKVALVGYSLGGRIALHLACKHQELLDCLVLEGASPGIKSESERRDRRLNDDLLADELERRGIGWFVDHWEDTPLFATQKELPRSAFQAVRRDRLSNTAWGLATSLRTMGTGRMVPLWDMLSDLAIPVLIVVGARDAKYSEVAEAMRSRMGAGRVVKVEGAGHCVHVERPDEFAALLDGFLTMTTKNTAKKLRGSPPPSYQRKKSSTAERAWSGVPSTAAPSITTTMIQRMDRRKKAMGARRG
jgi:2-succinyl-6-hydroxy-2,4-cyclohexadiene-1-carboxylate synthase